MMGQKFVGADRQSVVGMDKQLTDHLSFALRQFQKYPEEISGAMRKHQLKLADRQCRMAELSQRVQDTVVMLVTALWANQQKNQVVIGAADILCQDLRRKLTGERAPDHYYRSTAQLAEKIIAGGFPGLEDIPRQDILMKYKQ
jgi:acyl-CoA dehydrogenase